MRPKKHVTTGSDDLFRARLDQIINMKNELVQLAGKVDWDWLDGEIAPLYSDKGRPGISTRFAIGLLLLKHIYGLSDEGVCERWIYDPYFQYFTGEEFFQHEFPHERSDLSHWRKRLGDKLELLFADSLRVAHKSGALRSKDLERVTVDTTVQPKNISFPTDAKLLHAAMPSPTAATSTARRSWPASRQAYALCCPNRRARSRKAASASKPSSICRTRMSIAAPSERSSNSTMPTRNTDRRCAATGRTPARPAQSRNSAPQAKNAASRDVSMSTFSKPCSSGWIKILRPCAAGARRLSIPSAHSRCGWARRIS